MWMWTSVWVFSWRFAVELVKIQNMENSMFFIPTFLAAIPKKDKINKINYHD